MRKLRINHNEKGFTLIELMIVIAIIGILAAIAIPNFISYRDKSFCSAAESDANSLAGGLADYFAVPRNVSYASVALTPSQILFPGSNPINLTGVNSASITQTPTPTGNQYTILVQDTGGRCPQNYMAPGAPVNGEGWRWVAAGTSYFQKML
jgi:prepilin-type N-terminal cleavage/methylation domain-containing protein